MITHFCNHCKQPFRKRSQLLRHLLQKHKSIFTNDQIAQIEAALDKIENPPLKAIRIKPTKKELRKYRAKKRLNWRAVFRG